MSTADTIYERVKTLPEDQANLVLVFVEFVSQRTQPVSDPEQPSFARRLNPFVICLGTFSSI